MLRKHKKIIGVIPARGGSKGVIHKNIRLIAGKPLISYTIHAARLSEYIDTVIVSTDDDAIAKVAFGEGAEVMKRPPEISGDDSPTIDAILHVIDQLATRGLNPEVIVVLQPTSPLRAASDIDAALEIFLNNECNYVISVSEAPHPPFWSLEVTDGYLTPLFDNTLYNKRRQDLPRTYLPNGAIYISSRETLIKTHALYAEKTVPYLMPPDKSLDIDTELDFLCAEAIIRRQNQDSGQRETDE